VPAISKRKSSLPCLSPSKKPTARNAIAAGTIPRTSAKTPAIQPSASAVLPPLPKSNPVVKPPALCPHDVSITSSLAPPHALHRPCRPHHQGVDRSPHHRRLAPRSHPQFHLSSPQQESWHCLQYFRQLQIPSSSFRSDRPLHRFYRCPRLASPHF